MKNPILVEVEKLGETMIECMDEVRGRVETLEAQKDRPGIASPDESKAMKEFGQLLRGEVKEMSMGTAADGGATVPELIAAPIIERALAQSRLASIVRNSVTPTSDYVRLLNLRGQAASWSAETGTRSDSASFQLREIRPTHGELFSVVPVTNWLLNDAQFDIAGMVASNASDQFAKAIELAVYSGSGSDQPTGLTNTTPVATADSSSPERAAAALEFVTTGADLANSLIDLYFTLKPEYRANAKWVVSSASLSVIRQLRDSSGSGFLWQQSLAQGIDAPDGMLLGKPVFTSENLPTIGGSPQTLGVFCGDFEAGYELVRIGGMSILSDPYTVKGKTKFYISQRFGGHVVDNDAIKVLAA